MTEMTPLSVLDLSPIVEGSDAAQSLRNTLDLARHAERWGFRRYWLAEHHNSPGIASAATAVVIGHVAAGTSSIRVGAGGIMLPNHAPLVIAEQFGTLAALFPGRIDLGLGRAPGTDQLTAQALRRNLVADVDTFPQDVIELMSYFLPVEPGQQVRAIPGAGLDVPVWILGSSLFGAQLAAALGLPYAFASHFAPAEMNQAVALYRARFQPSPRLAAPYVMLGLNVCAAATDAEARRLFSSHQQAVIARRTGRRGPLPLPVEDFERGLDARAQMIPQQAVSCPVVGSPETVTRGLAALMAGTRTDEIMVTGNIFDHAARLRSFEIAAQAHQMLGKAAHQASSSALGAILVPGVDPGRAGRADPLIDLLAARPPCWTDRPPVCAPAARTTEHFSKALARSSGRLPSSAVETAQLPGVENFLGLLDREALLMQRRFGVRSAGQAEALALLAHLEHEQAGQVEQMLLALLRCLHSALLCGFAPAQRRGQMALEELDERLLLRADLHQDDVIEAGLHVVAIDGLQVTLRRGSAAHLLGHRRGRHRLGRRREASVSGQLRHHRPAGE